MCEQVRLLPLPGPPAHPGSLCLSQPQMTVPPPPKPPGASTSSKRTRRQRPGHLGSGWRSASQPRRTRWVPAHSRASREVGRTRQRGTLEPALHLVLPPQLGTRPREGAAELRQSPESLTPSWCSSDYGQAFVLFPAPRLEVAKAFVPVPVGSALALLLACPPHLLWPIGGECWLFFFIC